MPPPELVSHVTELYAARFGSEPAALVWAPGRVNLIGEHTDYNDGYVLPMAIDRGVAIAVTPAGDDEVTLVAADFEEEAHGRLDALAPGSRAPGEPHWFGYVLGTAWALLQQHASLRGWLGVMAGDLPIGAGLSSSAAVEMAAARAFCLSSGLSWDSRAMARAGQRAENEWVGVNCGIMDQMVCAAAREAHALLLDCRSLDCEQVPLPADCAVVVLDSGTRRGLVDSAYNERRSQCDAAARHCAVTALRDLDSTRLAQVSGTLEATTARRARHVVSEIERTLAAAEAMRSGDSDTLGILMNESHRSLRDDFEVSTDALDALVAAAQQHNACFGARMTGAGFGGCAVALVRQAHMEPFCAKVCADYRAATGYSATAYPCRPSGGACVVR